MYPNVTMKKNQGVTDLIFSLSEVKNDHFLSLLKKNRRICNGAELFMVEKSIPLFFLIAR